MTTRRKLASVLCSLLLLSLATSAHAQTVSHEAATHEVKDATGTNVHLPLRPERIITLAPSVGELAADLLGDQISRIIGVSEYTDYPPKLARVRSIGPYAQINLETIVALKPDLILATLVGNSRDQVLHLRELGQPVFVVASNSFAEIEESMRLAGRAVGAPELGEKMADELRDGVEQVKKRTKAHAGAPKKVLLQLGDDPLIVVGKRSFLTESLETVGAENVYQSTKDQYPRPSLEETVSKNPDVILVLALGRDTATFQRMARKWGNFPTLSAVKSKHVKILKADPLLRPSLRVLEGLSLLEHAVYD